LKDFLDTLRKIETIIHAVRQKEKLRLIVAPDRELPIEALHEAETILSSVSRMLIFLEERRDALATRKK